MRYLFCSYDIEKLRTFGTTHIPIGRYGYSLYGINATEICFSYESLGLVHQNIFNNLPEGYFILTVDSVPFYAFTVQGTLYRRTTPGNILEVNRDIVAERYPLYQEDDLVWDEYDTLKYSNNELYISSMGGKTIWINKDLDISNLDCLTNSYQLPEDEYKFDIQERKLLSMIL